MREVCPPLPFRVEPVFSFKGRSVETPPEKKELRFELRGRHAVSTVSRPPASKASPPTCVEFSTWVLQDRHMARRRKNDGIVDDLHELFMHVPAWVCIPVAAIAYLGVSIGLNILAGQNPLLKGIAQNGQMFAGMAALVVLATGFTAAVKKWTRRQLYTQQSGIGSIRTLKWADFELLIGEAYRRQGYQVTENGGGGADGGIDLIIHREGERALVQCKHWQVYKVGVKPIRELYGVLVAERADRAICVTSGTYTQEAKVFAQGKPIELIDGALLERMIAPVRRQEPDRNLITMTDKPSKPDAPPACPLCKSPMVLRTAKRGPNAGSQFWGCSMFATTGCKGMRQAL